eukprot:891068-Amphidinium_carterae.1
MQHVVLPPCKNKTHFYLDAGKHMQAVDKGFASYAATHQRPLRCSKASKKLGRRRARRVERWIGMEEARDSFLAKAWNHPHFGLYADNGGTVYTRTLKSVSGQLSAKTSSREMWGAGSTQLRIPLALLQWFRTLPGILEARGAPSELEGLATICTKGQHVVRTCLRFWRAAWNAVQVVGTTLVMLFAHSRFEATELLSIAGLLLTLLPKGLR